MFISRTHGMPHIFLGINSPCHSSHSYGQGLYNNLGSAAHWALTLSCTESPEIISDEYFHLQFSIFCHRILKSTRLKMTFKIIKFNLWSNTSLSTSPQKPPSFGVWEEWVCMGLGCPFSCPFQQNPKATKTCFISP